jgi:dTDP-L-rhamnose 4-epimerase
VRILVTGGAGFIGSHIVDALVRDGHRVRVVDSLLALAHRRRPDYLNPAAEYVIGDIAQPSTVARALDGIEAVSHQASMVGQGIDLHDAPAFAHNNDLGTARLLGALAQQGFEGRLVLASSMVVYGEGSYHCAVHGPVRPGPRGAARLDAGDFEPRCPDCGTGLVPDAVTELAPLDPRNLYAATKVHQEHLCRCFERERSVSVVVLRYHNVYGPRMPRDTPYAGVASIFASALAAGQAPRCYEDGGQLRDFVHVRDVARANVAALTVADPISGAFNVASGRPRTIRELADTLSTAYGHGTPAPVVTGDFRLGDVRHVFAAVDRARDRLGFTAGEDFDAGMVEFARAPLRAA